MRRNLVSFLIKLAISAALIALLLDRVDLAAVGSRIADASLGWMLIAFLMFAMLILFAVVRWWIVLRVITDGLSFTLTIRLVLIGQFFNQTLPSSIGGDALRVFYTWRAGIDPARAFNSVLLDRVAGLVVLIALGTAILPFLESRLDDALTIAGLRTLIIAGWAAVLGLAIFDNPWSRRLERFRVVAFGLQLSRDARMVARRPLSLVSVVAAALLVHLFTFALAWSIDHALGGNASYSIYFIAMVPTQLAISIPISIAGWGVREQALVILLGALGIASVHAASVSILFGLVLLVGGLPGGLAWLTARKQPDRRPVAASAD